VTKSSSEAVVEAILLPLLLLTVALLGGLRDEANGGMLFLPPPLVSLVLALLLVGVMIGARLLVPVALMHPSRSPLENMSGAVLLACLFVASAQLFNMLTPEAGLLQFFFVVLFLVLLWTTAAARPGAVRLVRSLFVMFGSAFVLKYIILAALYAPQPSLTKRVLLVLLEGATLGTLGYRSHGPLTGYVAFFTLVIYVVAVLLLPRGRSSNMLALRMPPGPALPDRLAD
jgi:hypothetical protein